MESLLGAAGVALAWVLAGSQWWRARREVAGISVATWAIFLSVNIGWLCYGLSAHSWHLVANAGVAIGFNLALLLLLGAFKPLVAGIAVGLAVAAVGFLGFWGGAVAAITLGAVALRWPQIVKLWKSLDVGGVSLVSWLAALANNIVWSAFWVVRGDRLMILSSFVIAGGTVLLVALLLWRRNKQR